MSADLSAANLIGHALDVLNDAFGVAAKVELYLNADGAYTAKWSDHRSTLIAYDITMEKALSRLAGDIGTELQRRMQNANAGRQP